jgi:transposase
MANDAGAVIGGVDTHKHTHHAAVIDERGQLLGDREFRTDAYGQAELLAWLRSHGPVAAVGVEGTGFYGAALTKHLRSSRSTDRTGPPVVPTASRTASTPSRPLERCWP